MKRAIEQETLQALVETGAARTGEAVALADAVGRFCEGIGIKVLTVEL